MCYCILITIIALNYSFVNLFRLNKEQRTIITLDHGVKPFCMKPMERKESPRLLNKQKAGSFF